MKVGDWGNNLPWPCSTAFSLSHCDDSEFENGRRVEPRLERNKTLHMMRRKTFGDKQRSRHETGYSALVRLPSSRSNANREATSSPISFSFATISLDVFSSSTCSVTNHCK